MAAPRDRYLQQIAQDPEAEQAYEVYADLLQQQGDPRGELIALMLAGAERAAQQHLRDHEDAFFGAIAYYRKKVRLTWRYGFIAQAQLRLDPDHGALVMDALMTLESARFLRSVRLLDLELDSRCAALEIMCREPRAFLHTLLISGTLLTEIPQRSLTDRRLGDAPALPATASADRLERALSPILDARNLPALRTLSLSQVRPADRVLHLLSRAPLVSQLSELNLTGCALTDSSVEAFSRLADRGAQLRAVLADESSLSELSAKAHSTILALAQRGGWRLNPGL